MDNLTFLHTVAVLLAAALAGIAIYAPRPMLLRASAVLLAGFLMVTAFTALSDLLGRPKPATLEWAAGTVEDSIVVASDMREGEAIYLWLRVDGGEEPRAYVLPWSMQAARQLRKAEGEAERKGTAVRMRGAIRAVGDEGERMFYADPQPPLPAKLVHNG